MKRVILIAMLIITTKDIYSQNQLNNKTMKTAKELMQDYHRGTWAPCCREWEDQIDQGGYEYVFGTEID